MKQFLSEYKDIIPVITFIMGYILNALIQAVKSKYQVHKIKKVLIHETSRNLCLLEMALEHEFDSDSEGKALFERSKVIARVSEAMGSHIFESHVAYISRMKDRDIDNFLHFYSAMESLKRHGKELVECLNIENRNESQSKQILARVQAVNGTAESLLKMGRKNNFTRGV